MATNTMGDVIVNPYIKITLGKLGDKNADTFTLGDDKLISCSLQLGEGKNVSNCNFKVHDPERKLVDKYFTYIESIDGLEPLEEPQQNLNSDTPESLEDDGRPGQVIFNNVEATVYNPAKGGINGNIAGGTYKDKLSKSELDSNGNIKWATGLYAAMVNRKYALAFMRVTNLNNNKSVVVKVVDRGPFVSGKDLREHPTRKIDLTPKAFNAIAPAGGTYPPGGVLNVKIEWLETNTTTITTANKEQTSTEQAKTSKIDLSGQLNAGAISNASGLVTASIAKAKSPEVELTPRQQTLAGSQITIELGANGETISAYSFIHTSLNYNLDSPNLLEFGGQAANWVLTQKIKNTIYTNMTFKKLATKILESYGLTLDMLDEGPKYEYFPQRGQTDYDSLLIEAKRLGYKVYVKGPVMYIKTIEQVNAGRPIFTQVYGSDLGLKFDVSHTAQSSSSGGARSSEPNEVSRTGERKFSIDINSGLVQQIQKENLAGTGASNIEATTGTTILPVAPIVTGESNIADSQRKDDTSRLKGITASTDFPTTVNALLLEPDTLYKTEGLSEFLDRYWVIDSVTHTFENGSFNTSLNVYSPLKNKYPTAALDPSGGGNSPLVSGEDFDPTSPKFRIPASGVYFSPYGMRKGRMHNGVDISAPTGTPIYASAAGTVSFVGWNAGGYGNYIIIDHGQGWSTLYGHNSKNQVTKGQVVSQGTQIALMGSTGLSTGPHVHFEIRKGDSKLNPSRYLNLGPLKGKVAANT